MCLSGWRKQYLKLLLPFTPDTANFDADFRQFRSAENSLKIKLPLTNDSSRKLMVLLYTAPMSAAVNLKITKIAISHQRIDRSSRNLARLCKMSLLTAQTVKNLNFWNSTEQTAAILKTVISLYLSNRLTDFYEIWHGDADWTPAGDRPLKFRIFQKPRWRRPPSWLITKIAISPQRFHRSLRNLVC